MWLADPASMHTILHQPEGVYYPWFHSRVHVYVGLKRMRTSALPTQALYVNHYAWPHLLYWCLVNICIYLGKAYNMYKYRQIVWNFITINQNKNFKMRLDHFITHTLIWHIPWHDSKIEMILKGLEKGNVITNLCHKNYSSYPYSTHMLKPIT